MGLCRRLSRGKFFFLERLSKLCRQLLTKFIKMSLIIKTLFLSKIFSYEKRLSCIKRSFFVLTKLDTVVKNGSNVGFFYKKFKKTLF